MYRKLVWTLAISALGFMIIGSMSCSKIDKIATDREPSRASYRSPLPPDKSPHHDMMLAPERSPPPTAVEVSGFENANTSKALVGFDPSQDCAKHLGIRETDIKSLNTDGKRPLYKGEGLTFSYHGNNGDFATKLIALAPGASISGHCIYLDGAQNQVLIEVGIDLPKLKIVSMGRKTDITVHVARGATLGGMVVDIADPDSSLYVLGSGSYDCSKNLNLVKSKIDVSCSIF